MGLQKYNVLVVEDSKPDSDLLQFLLGQVQCPIDVHLVDDGQKASDFVFKRSGYESTPGPDLVILDLNLPRKNGSELLAEFKAEGPTRNMPVVVFSTSNSDREINEAYRLGACGFVVKPVDIEEYQKVVSTVCEYWFQCARLPHPPIL